MKLSTLIILITILLYGLIAQSQPTRTDTVKMLCQTWKIKSLSHEPESEELREDWNEWKNNVRFRFSANNVAKQIFDDEVEAVKWEYDSNKKIIILKGEVDNFWYLKSISPTKLEVEFLTIFDTKKMVNAILIPSKN